MQAPSHLPFSAAAASSTVTTLLPLESALLVPAVRSIQLLEAASQGRAELQSRVQQSTASTAHLAAAWG